MAGSTVSTRRLWPCQAGCRYRAQADLSRRPWMADAGFSWDRLALNCATCRPKHAHSGSDAGPAISALEFDRVLNVADEDWSGALTLQPAQAGMAATTPGSADPRPAGRYLWLKMSLFSDGNVSPSISEIDVFAPRASALRHLPASFHQDPESARFLDRFLSYFDTIFSEISSKNRNIAAYLDPQAGAEGQFLDWLGSWFDLTSSPNGTWGQRRAMIAQAMEYYSIRGTVQGC